MDYAKDRYQDSVVLNEDCDEAVIDDAMEQWRRAWSALFGLGAVMIFSPSHELNARVYTLDGKNGYRVEHKRIRGAHSFSTKDFVATHSHFPNKARCGEKHGRSKLVREDILKIRAWAREVLAKGQIPCWTNKAADFGVSEGTLRDIVKRRTWSHVDDM